MFTLRFFYKRLLLIKNLLIRALGILSALAMFMSFQVLSATLHDKFPEQFDSNAKYLVYSHGLIGEGSNARPIHPKFGPYEFEQIKQALTKGNNTHVVAHQRPKGTDKYAYAKSLAQWVERAISAGVNPSQITLVGFSRGGEITAYASSHLYKHGINTVLLATCWRGSVQDQTNVELAGHFLSIFESTDGARSCQKLAKRSGNLASFTEVEISTGLEHGAFFTPQNDWLKPLQKWLTERS